MSDSRQIIKQYLNNHGILNQAQIDEITSGFDLSKTVYENRIWPDDKLFQFVRNPNSSFNELRTGRWFSLAGASMDSLAIFSGASGRQLTQFRVNHPIVVLEGTAVKLARDWNWEGGGEGGATQLFIPEKLLYALEVIGNMSV